MPSDAPGPPRKLRLFLALWPDEATRGAVASWQQKWRWPSGAARVAPGQLHVTVHFLGDVEGQRLPALTAGLQVAFEGFDLDLGRAEVWPHGLAVLCPHDTPAALLRLHSALAQRCLDLDLPVDARPYRPHITLARRAVGACPPPEGPGLRWPACEGYVLVRSLPGGAGYQVLERFG